MRIVIGGMAKSGTTALFYSVLRGMPIGTLCLFEPKRYWPRPVPNVLAKILSNPGVEWASFKHFQRRIYIARDPRDRLISAGLYWVFDHPEPIGPEAAARILDVLRRKETDSGSLSFREICTEISRVLGGDRVARYLNGLELGCRAFLEYRDFHQVRYEDFVAGELREIEDYLGFALPRLAKVDPLVKRVERTRGSGDWRNWFTPADVDFFRPRMREAFTVLGYDDVWDLPPSSGVDPKHGSEYMARLIAQQRERFARPALLKRVSLSRLLRSQLPAFKLRN